MSAPVQGTRLRSVGVGVVAALAIVGVLASTLAVWARVTLFDSEKIGSAVSDALAEPAVAQAIAVYVTDQVLVLTDLEDRVVATLPSNLQVLAPAIVGGASNLVEDRVASLLSTEQVQRVVERLAVASHRAALHLLEGGGLGKGVSVEDGVVTLNLLPIIGMGIEVLQDNGLFVNTDFPDLSGDDPEAQVAALSEAIGRPLPDDFGQIVVYSSESLASAESTLAAAQNMLALFKRAVVLIVLVTVALVGATILLSRDRRRTTLTMALGIVAAMVVARVAINRVVAKIPLLFTEPGARAAARSMATDLTTGLLRLALLLTILGIVAALAAWLSGASASAVSLRARLGAGRGSAKETVLAHPGGFAVASYGVALLSLLVFGLGWTGLLLAVAFAAGGIWLQVQAPPAPIATPPTPTPSAP